MPPSPPPVTTGALYVAEYVGNQGSAHAAAYVSMYWQSAFTTISGTLIEWGTGDHNTYGDNGVREYDPIAKSQTYVYPNNNGARDVTQYDNLHYWYIPRIDSLVIPSRGQYARASRSWVRGESFSSKVVGTGSTDLIRPLSGADVNALQSSYNAHQAWSAQHDAGVVIGGCQGCEKNARPYIWICAPGSGLGISPQPYAVFQRSLSSVGGVAPNLSNGRDGCSFLGDYVYWIGGTRSDTTEEVPYFFRMDIRPHLTNTSAALQIERLPDAPAGFKMGLLRADPYNNALLCVTDKGVFAYDVSGRSWIVVTPSGYVSDYAGFPGNGYMPRGCLGDFIDVAGGQSLRRFYWRPGDNTSWSYDGTETNVDRMKRRFRSIKLERRNP